MAKQTYINPHTKQEICFEMASMLIQLPENCRKEWLISYNSGNLSKLIVSGGEIFTTAYESFHLDVDTRRVESADEIDVDFALFFPPFICVSVLFAVSNEYSPFSIGPHMDNDSSLHFSMQIAEMIKKNPPLQAIKLTDEFPLSLCIEEPFLLNLSPDQHLISEKQFDNAIEALAYHERNGKEFWPVSICIEPLPTMQIEDSLTCRTGWTQNLGRAWFEVEHLISRFCPDAAIGGRFSKLFNYCNWLYQWTEGMSIGSEEKDDLNGGPIIALRKIASEWRAWSKIHDLDLYRTNNKNYIPDWNVACVKDLENTLGYPVFDVLLSCFQTKKIGSDQQSVLNSLISQYNLAFNPLAVAGVELSNIVLNQAVNVPSAAWCINTKIMWETDGFRSIQRCGQIMVRALEKDVVSPTICNNGDCLFVGGPNLKDIYERQKAIDDCIGIEQNFGINNLSGCKCINDLWDLANQYLCIVDRYFKADSLQYITNIPSNIIIRLLVSDDDHKGKNRREQLKEALVNKKISSIEIKVVTCTQKPSSHPLHDRYVFSLDWGASLSSSFDAVESNALWAFKLEDYNKLQSKYFDYFWNAPIGVSIPYGPRSFEVNDLL